MLPTSTVGSHGLPGWVWLAREAMAAGRLGALDLRELTEDATQIALADQERAGVDVLTTGEMGRVRFIIGFYDRLTGIRALDPPRRLGQPLWDTNSPFEVVDRLAAPDGLGIVEEFRLARTLTGRPQYLCSEAAIQAGDACLDCHGGYGFAEEYDVERKFRESRLYRTAPINNNLVAAYVGEHVLGMPRSY
jgi:alkylation response protein AidB-like acyl-CoA dehydrogenase